MVGNLVEKTVNSVKTDYIYDDIDRLLSEARSGYSDSYSYDANGNRATKTLNCTAQTYVNDDADKTGGRNRLLPLTRATLSQDESCRVCA